MTGRRPRRLVSLLTVALLSVSVVASSYWSAPGTGTASAATADLAAATITAPVSATNSITVTWTSPASLQPSSPANSAITYEVQRRLGAGSYAAVSSGGCSGAKPYATASCADVPPATGTYSYRVVATFHSWTATSADSGAVSFLLDTTAPTVVSIVLVGSSPTNSAAVSWTVTLSEPVTGVGSGDFALARAGGLTGGSITGVTGSATTWIVTSSTGSGDGSLGLNLVDDDSIVDVAANVLGGAGAGNGNLTGPIYTLDRTAPALVSLITLDTNANGKVDRVTATFNETLASSSAAAPWTLANVPSAGTLSSVSTSGAVATLVLNEGTGAIDTTVGSATVALAASSIGIRDALGNQASFSTTAPSDGVAPVRTSMQMLDTGTANGKVDRVTVTFSETLASSTLTTQWTLAAVPGAGSLASVSTSGLVATLVLTEGNADTAIGSFTVALTAASSGIRDTAGVQSSFSATAPADAAAPVQDCAGDARLRRRRQGRPRRDATFSEALASSTLTSQWTLVGVPSGGALLSVSTSGSVATLTLTEGSGAANTAAGSFSSRSRRTPAASATPPATSRPSPRPRRPTRRARSC